MLGIALALVYPRMGSGNLPYRQADDRRLIRVDDIATLRSSEGQRQAFTKALSTGTEDLEANFTECRHSRLKIMNFSAMQTRRMRSTKPDAPSSERTVRRHEQC